MRRTIFEPEHDDFRESVRGFLRKEAVPKTEEWEAAGVIDRGFWRKAAEQGFVAFSAPEEHGGLGHRRLPLQRDHRRGVRLHRRGHATTSRSSTTSSRPT